MDFSRIKLVNKFLLIGSVAKGLCRVIDRLELIVCTLKYL